MKASKTKTSFYRRLLVAQLISSGTNTVPAIQALTAMPRRTAQDTISALAELGICCEFIGATKDGYYHISNWGPINPEWVNNNMVEITELLNYTLE
ncbi:hypothetical protein EDC56_0393 [Sinobacterium caligoides]|uniref:Uncharacterized protein n=1 Tax=Sinobacterium caligoides TaxID=933926 RepID=A0A3N2DYM8_9GAMM|nr:winged helix-turn-helix domain-containing protein [Sinobacterium caligoides]ROS04877.1 hypothetical protein EDC56_0393 [Sinobacterium caligoides]